MKIDKVLELEPRQEWTDTYLNYLKQKRLIKEIKQDIDDQEKNLACAKNRLKKAEESEKRLLQKLTAPKQIKEYRGCEPHSWTETY